jgi:hypothetical protein
MSLQATAVIAKKNPPKSVHRLRVILAFLFSMSVALPAVWAINQGLSRLVMEEFSLQYRINTFLGLNTRSSVGGNMAAFAVVLAITLCIFLPLMLLSRTFGARWILRTVAGPVSLIALPVCRLHFAPIYWIPPGLPNPPSVWLVLEIAGVIVCAILYLYAKWPLPTWGSVLLLVLHLGLWHCLAFGGPYFWRRPVLLIFPATAFCATLAWGLYVSKLRGSPD